MKCYSLKFKVNICSYYLQVTFANIDIYCIVKCLLYIIRPRRIHAVHEMWHIATDAACSVVCVSVCLLVIRASCTRTDEPVLV